MWAAVFIFPFSALSQSKPLRQIYVGVSSVSMGNIIIYVTKEAKLFEKYGLYADPVAMRGSGESSKAMMLRKQSWTLRAAIKLRRFSSAGPATARGLPSSEVTSICGSFKKPRIFG